MASRIEKRTLCDSILRDAIKARQEEGIAAVCGSGLQQLGLHHEGVYEDPPEVKKMLWSALMFLQHESEAKLAKLEDKGVLTEASLNKIMSYLWSLQDIEASFAHTKLTIEGVGALISCLEAESSKNTMNLGLCDVADSRMESLSQNMEQPINDMWKTLPGLVDMSVEASLRTYKLQDIIYLRNSLATLEAGLPSTVSLDTTPMTVIHPCTKLEQLRAHINQLAANGHSHYSQEVSTYLGKVQTSLDQWTSCLQSLQVLVKALHASQTSNEALTAESTPFLSREVKWIYDELGSKKVFLERLLYKLIQEVEDLKISVKRGYCTKN